ncbi:hypothetical protein ACLBWP_05030 [Microbacterium sp. M1A1_1b]
MPRGNVGVVAAVTLLVVTLSGCSFAGTVSCRDGIQLDTAQDRMDAAPLVVDAHVRATDRTVDVEGDYRLLEATVTEVVKGTAPSRSLELFSPSDQCTSSGKPVEYLDDVLAEPGRYRLYLTAERPGLWRLIVPGAADPLDADGNVRPAS